MTPRTSAGSTSGSSASRRFATSNDCERSRRHDALPALLELLQPVRHAHLAVHRRRCGQLLFRLLGSTYPSVEPAEAEVAVGHKRRSEEHTSELQSRLHLVCRLLLEKKKHKQTDHD